MKTEVIMQRDFSGYKISQKSKSEFFSATDLVKAGNKMRTELNKSIFNLSAWLKTKSTIAFINELKKNINTPLIIKSRGKNTHTWVHPFILIDLAMAINPKFKVTAIKWLHDKLLSYRNDSGDSYKKMAGSIGISYHNKSKFIMIITNAAKKIKAACKVDDWQKATEHQLKLRDKMHNNIALLCDVIKTEQAIEIGIEKALND